jgi:hypothetical protein
MLQQISEILGCTRSNVITGLFWLVLLDCLLGSCDDLEVVVFTCALNLSCQEFSTCAVVHTTMPSQD